MGLVFIIFKGVSIWDHTAATIMGALVHENSSLKRPKYWIKNLPLSNSTGFQWNIENISRQKGDVAFIQNFTGVSTVVPVKYQWSGESKPISDFARICGKASYHSVNTHVEVQLPGMWGHLNMDNLFTNMYLEISSVKCRSLASPDVFSDKRLCLTPGEIARGNFYSDLIQCFKMKTMHLHTHFAFSFECWT